MGWQEPNYKYPVPEQPDIAGSLVKGGVVGYKMGAGISDRIQEKTLQNDIAAAWKSGEAKVADIDAKHAEAIAAAPHEQSFVKQPDQAQPEGIKAAMGGNPELVANTELAPRPLSIDPGKNQITGNKALMMAGVTPMETPGVLSPSEKATETQIMADVATKNPAELDKITQEYKTKRIEAKAGTWNDLYGVYMKHGKVKEALEIQDKYFDQVVKVGALDYKTGTKLWNNSFLKDKYGEIDLTPKPKFKVVGDHGSYIKVNETTGEVAPIQSVGELKSQDPTHNVYMKVTDKDGNIAWNQIQFGKPKEPTGDNLRKFKNEKGEEVTEELVNGKWVQKATSPAKEIKEESAAKKKDSMKRFDDLFIQTYGESIVDETGKAPDKNAVLAKMGKSEVTGKLDGNGKPITLQQLHNSMQQFYEAQLDKGVGPAEALNNTIQYGQDFGNTKKKAVDLKLPAGQSDAITQSISKHKADGFAIQMNPNTGVIRAVKGSEAKILWDGKATTPGRTASAKPSGTPAPSVVKTAEAAETKTATGQQPSKKGDVKITISMTGGNNLVFSTNAPAAEAIKRKMNALDTLVRQGGLTPKQRDAELRSYAQSYM
jgi:hypothetical protein